jgi:hypothetical protein
MAYLAELEHVAAPYSCGVLSLPFHLGEHVCDGFHFRFTLALSRLFSTELAPNYYRLD